MVDSKKKSDRPDSKHNMSSTDKVRQNNRTKLLWQTKTNSGVRTNGLLNAEIYRSKQSNKPKKSEWKSNMQCRWRKRVREWSRTVWQIPHIETWCQIPKGVAGGFNGPRRYRSAGIRHLVPLTGHEPECRVRPSTGRELWW